MLNVIRNFIGSEKAVALGVLMIVASVLAALGKMTIDQWIDYSKWMAAFYVGGKAIQGAAASVSGAKAAQSKLINTYGELNKLKAAIEANGKADDKAAENTPDP